MGQTPTFLWFNEVSAVLVTALIAAVIAVWGVMSQRALAARQATILHLARWEADRELLKARVSFDRALRAEGGLGVWAAPANKSSSELQDILTVLNEYELTAVGLQRGILDLEIFIRICRTRTIQDCKASAGFIHNLEQRVSSEAQRPVKLFAEFRDLAEMLEDPKRSKRSYFWSRFI